MSYSIPEWRAAMLQFAREPGNQLTALGADKTHLPMTLYIGERFPALILDEPGRHSPGRNARAYVIGETTTDAAVDMWVAQNLPALRDYNDGRIGADDFLRRLTPA